MPTPLGHGCAGLAVHLFGARNDVERADWRRAAVIVGAAIAPDLDLLLRWVDGRNHHQGDSHTLAAALVVGAAVACLGRLARWTAPARLGVFAALGWASHVLLDYLGQDTNPPIGLRVFWPVTDRLFKFPWPVFMEIGRTIDAPTLVHDGVAGLWELAVMAPILWLALRRRARSAH